MVAICRCGRYRPVAVSYGVKQCFVQCSSARLSRHEWLKRTYIGECDVCSLLSDWPREMANSAVDKMVSPLTESFEKFNAPPPPVSQPSAKRRPRGRAELARRDEKSSRECG
eukprot:471122-Pyramimonas_sp.AAC.1